MVVETLTRKESEVVVGLRSTSASELAFRLGVTVHAVYKRRRSAETKIGKVVTRPSEKQIAAAVALLSDPGTTLSIRFGISRQALYDRRLRAERKIGHRLPRRPRMPRVRYVDQSLI